MYLHHPEKDVHLIEGLEASRHGGKGSGASLELIKARIVHAFEGVVGPSVNMVQVQLPGADYDGGTGAYAKALERYRSFGFVFSGVHGLLTKEKYDELKKKGDLQARANGRGTRALLQVITSSALQINLHANALL